jgi:hypothetical protein
MAFNAIPGGHVYGKILLSTELSTSAWPAIRPERSS